MTSLLRTLSAACLLLIANGSFGLSVSVFVESVQCGYTSSATASPTGGTPPYTYLWNTGATTQTITGTIANVIYSCTVTDAIGATASDSGWAQEYINFQWAIQNVLPACNVCEGEVLLDTLQLPGHSPYTITPSPTSYVGSVAHFTGLCSFEFLLNISDGAGCNQTIPINIGAQAYLNATVTGTIPGCNSAANGSVSLEIWLDNTPLNTYAIDFRILDDMGAVVVEPGSFAGPPSAPYPVTIDELAPGDYTAQGSFASYCDPAVFNVPFTIPDLGPDCGNIEGVVWYDIDQDCVQEAGATRIPYRVNTILPGPHYVITDGNGQFSRGLDFGNYTIQQSSADLVQVCPASAPVAFTLDASNQNVFIEFGDTSTIAFDLDVDCYIGAARPGFDVEAVISIQNLSIYPSGIVTAAYTYSTELQFVSADITPSVQTPGYLEWQLPVINGYGWLSIHPLFTLQADPLLLGTLLSASATITNDAAEINVSNNWCYSSRTITGSYDPNEKEGSTSSASSDTQYFLDTDESITYTIRFQNTGTDTAFTVVLRDELDTDLDIASLQLLTASHTFIPSFGQGRELVFTFEDINLPDSTTDLLGSQGFVRYRIKPNSNIIVGDVLENTAEIHFDFNPPIITNITSHIVDLSTGIQGRDLTQGKLSLQPNPASDVLMVSGSANGPIEVVATDGRIVTVPVERRSTGYELDVRTLAPGMYVVRSTTGSARFVKK